MENMVQVKTRPEEAGNESFENQSPASVVTDSTGDLRAADEPRANLNATAMIPEKVKMQVEAEKKISTNVMSICLTSDGIVIKDEEKGAGELTARGLSGVYCEGVQYYDLNGIQYINNTGLAILIDLLKALLEMGVEVQFVNVHESIKKKIRETGLEKIIKCGEKTG